MKIKRLVILVLVFLSAVGYHQSHKFVNIDPTDVDALIDQGTTREIKIPGFSHAYNPSIVTYKDGYLLSFRVDYHNLKTWIKKMRNHRTSFLGVVLLDRDFRIVSTPQLMDVRSYSSKEPSAPQDARLFCSNGKIYAFYNDYLEPKKGSQQLYIANLIEENGHFRIDKAPRRLVFRESKQKLEKNWSPFSYRDELYVTYWIEPHTVLKVDPDSGDSTRVDLSEAKLEWNFGQPRGGTPTIFVDGKYLSFFHSCKKGIPSLLSKKKGKVYFMGAYLFQSEPPFQIEKYTPNPIGTRKNYFRNNPKKIMYPGGIVADGDFIHVVWGQSDARICLSTFDKSELVSKMIPADISTSNRDIETKQSTTPI